MVADRAKKEISGLVLRWNQYRSVHGEAALESLRRFRRFIVVLFPAHLGFAWQFAHYQAPLGQLGLVEWASTIATAHTVMAALDALMWLAITWHLRRRESANRISYGLVFGFSAAYVMMGSVLSLADVKVGAGAGITSFLMTSVMVGVAALMHPVLSASLFAASYWYFQHAIVGLGLSASQAASIQAVSAATPLLAMLTSFTIWRQYVKAVLAQRELSARNTELQYLAQHDPLTGLNNRRHFTQEANAELARALRARAPTSILIVDIDFFKKVNDQYGHPAGDLVLKEVAGVLLDTVRATDVVARLGGEEFIVLMPHTALEGALALGEKLRRNVSGRPMHAEGQALTVTISIGVSELAPAQKGDFEDLYFAADTALYAAKAKGRNRVEWQAPVHPG